MSILSYFSCCRKRKTTVDDLPDILQKLVIAQKPKQAKQALKLLLAVADEANRARGGREVGQDRPGCTPGRNPETRCSDAPR